MRMVRTSGMGGSEFSALVKEFRERTGIPQIELSRRMGISQSYMHRIESGDRPPPPVVMIERIGIALGLTPEERNRLRVVGGFAPDFRGTPWELVEQLIDVFARCERSAGTVQGVLDVFSSHACSDRDREEYAAVIGAMSTRYLASVGEPRWLERQRRAGAKG